MTSERPQDPIQEYIDYYNSPLEVGPKGQANELKNEVRVQGEGDMPTEDPGVNGIISSLKTVFKNLAGGVQMLDFVTLWRPFIRRKDKGRL